MKHCFDFTRIALGSAQNRNVIFIRMVLLPKLRILRILCPFLVAYPTFAQTHSGKNIKDLLAPTQTGIVVIAHRGCHNPAPRHGLGFAPENSLLGLERCVIIGADMMELDVRMTADGYLVVMHDENVERTTNGRGNVADMTLSQLRELRLRQNLGGYAEPLTNEHIPTLDEVLKSARGRITLNLDVKDSSYPEVVEAVQRAAAVDYVIVKARAGIGSPALAGIEPFTNVSFMPILNGRNDDLLVVAEHQATANPVAFELPHMTEADLPKLIEFASRHKLKLLNNTLGDGFVAKLGGDNDALKDANAVWGQQFRDGISIFQTDQPEALVIYRGSLRP